MTKMAKKELITATKQRYLKAGKQEKTKILDEFCSNTGYHRKYAIAIFQPACDYHRVKREGRKQRKTVYGHDFMSVVVKIWELLEYPCGARLKPVLLSTALALERYREIRLTEDLKDKLSQVSARTLDRRLKRERQARRLCRSRGTTRHGSFLKSSIPIRITNWDISLVGFAEMDTVAHNGGDPSGEFIYSLDLLEIYSGWSEQRAVMGKGEAGIVRAVDNMKNNLPLELKGLDSDSGGEFINWHMVRYCKRNNLDFTRSRPDHKNDNAYVEQKHYTHIRKWLGYGRYDTQEQLVMINDLYANELRLFNNFFRPVMKIRSKEKVNNSVCRKTYDVAQPPYRRLIESGQISNETKENLTELYLSLNPVQLKRVIDKKIRNIRNSADSHSKNLNVSTEAAKVRFLNV